MAVQQQRVVRHGSLESVSGSECNSSPATCSTCRTSMQQYGTTDINFYTDTWPANLTASTTGCYDCPLCCYWPCPGVPARRLSQAPWTVNRTAAAVRVVDVHNKTVNASSKFDTRSPDNYGDFEVHWDFGQDDDGNPTVDLQGADVWAEASYPNVKFDNPGGWRFKTLANSTLVFVYPDALTTTELRLNNLARSDSKLAPATALASNYAERNGTVYSTADAQAMSRPGLQYGSTVAIADQNIVSSADYAYDYSSGARLATRARAQAGQGQTVALVKAASEVKQGVAGSEAYSDANSARWYMAPGHAVSGKAGYHGLVTSTLDVWGAEQPQG